jgi:hypothetical protein
MQGDARADVNHAFPNQAGWCGDPPLKDSAYRWLPSPHTACFHIRWKTTRIPESYGNLTRKTASQLQRFLGPNKGPGIFLRMRQEAVHTD